MVLVASAPSPILRRAGARPELQTPIYNFAPAQRRYEACSASSFAIARPLSIVSPASAMPALRSSASPQMTNPAAALSATMSRFGPRSLPSNTARKIAALSAGPPPAQIVKVRRGDAELFGVDRCHIDTFSVPAGDGGRARY